VLIYAPCGSRFADLARARGFEVWEEAFADRAYTADGSLVSRKKPGALLTSPQQVSRQVREMVLSGRVRCMDGSYFSLDPKTYCLHGDTPNAAEILRFLVNFLSGDSIHVQK
ncbi:MAG: LamB/YcsF family protein, partial [Robiginitalea sp.]|nr:LamB/YcsF family protein [Robiginitalea sp.]